MVGVCLNVGKNLARCHFTHGYGDFLSIDGMVLTVEFLRHNRKKIVRCICSSHLCSACKFDIDVTVTYNGQIKGVDVSKDVCFLDLVRIDVHRRVLNLIDWHLLHQ